LTLNDVEPLSIFGFKFNVQLDAIKPTLKAPGTNLLTPKYVVQLLLSNSTCAATTWVGSYTPTFSSIAGTSFSLDAQLGEQGNVYYIVIPRTSDAPPAGAYTLQLFSST
jgi:hypothetical protein